MDKGKHFSTIKLEEEMNPISRIEKMYDTETEEKFAALKQLVSDNGADRDVINLPLNRTQIANLIDFFDNDFIRFIKSPDVEIDNIQYLCEMCDIYYKLQKINPEG